MLIKILSNPPFYPNNLKVTRGHKQKDGMKTTFFVDHFWVHLMQTFLPYPDFKKSLQALDYRRLGKQRVEAYQIIRILKAASQSKVYRDGKEEATRHSPGMHRAYGTIRRGADDPGIRRAGFANKGRRMNTKRHKFGGGWRHHPAVKMWRGHINALKLYYNLCLDEWVRRGYKNRMQKMPIRGKISYPHWFGRNAFHAAHRSNLLRKNNTYYGNYNWQ